MKTVILAGGNGTRIYEETERKPKPMIEINGMPILWHIMKEFSYYNYNDFVVCAGYKQEYIKQWFARYFISSSDVTFNYREGNEIIFHKSNVEPWQVTIVDTGYNTGTGGRIKKIREYLNEEPFFITYGDGYANINIDELLEFHNRNGKIATLTAVKSPSMKGVLEVSSNEVVNFKEKDPDDEVWINGGFMVFQPSVFDYISEDYTSLERDCLAKLATQRQLGCYRHHDFWQCVDTLSEKFLLENYLANHFPGQPG